MIKMTQSACQELQAAVVALACEDYLNLLSGFSLATYDKTCPPIVSIEELESFFTGQDFCLFSDLDGTALMEKIRSFSKEMVVKINIKKVGRNWGCYRMDDSSETIIEGSVFRKKHDAITHAASLNHLSVFYYQKCRVRDGLNQPS